MPSTAEEFVATLGDYDTDCCPLLLQRFIPGQRINTCTIIRQGQIISHSVAPQCSPLLHNAKHTRDTLGWIEMFLQSYPVSLHGIFVFRFVVSAEDGKLYPLGCGNGLSSAFCLVKPTASLGKAVAGHEEPIRPIMPEEKFSYAFWFYQELWEGLSNLTNPTALLSRIRKVFRGKEAVFDFSDPLPFLALNHLHLPLLVFTRLIRSRELPPIDFPSGSI